MKCKLISPAHERQTPHHTKIYRKAVAHSRGIEVLESRIAPATFFVSNANDSGTGSLRQAILDANSTPNSGGADLISFASIPTGTFVIQPTSELPAISEAVIIDGYTAPGTSQNTAAIGTDALLRVVLSGSLLTSGSGLTLGVAGGDPAATGGSTVRGLVINDFHPGINDSGNGILIHSNNNKVEGNFLGTTTSGNAALGNSNSGVAVSHFGGSDTYADNVIGGPALADRNLISGNSLGISLRAAAMNTLVIGNLIGTDKTGQFAIPNTNAGILIGGNGNVIGGATLGMGNVISGNVGPGISIGVSNNTTVIGNIMGLNAAGTAVVQNSGPGILMNNSATNITIGGSGTGEGNVISGNFEAGIEIGSSVGDGPANNVIVRGNKIGTDVSGTLKLGNQHGGIKVFGSTGTTIGGTSPLDGNVIAFNTNAAGISVREDAGPSSVAILGNSIFGNSRLGIDLGGGKENFFGVTENDNFDADQGPNGLTNLPTLTNLNNSGTDVGFNFSISAQPSTNYRIEFFALAPGQVDVSGSGQGAVFLGSQDVNTNAAGQFVGNFAQPIGLPANSYFTATITDTSAGQTSEFSPALGLPGGTYTWNGAQSSDWFNPLNWSPNGVPGAFDTAIYSGGTNAIQLNGDAGVLHFQHSAGAMTGFGTLYVRDTFTWTGGSQDGTNIGFYGTTATINGGGQPLVWNALSFIINDGTLTIGGAGLVFNTGLFAINPNGSLILNAGVFDQDGSGTSSNTYNAGKIEKLGTGAFGLETTTVQNAGSIESRAGSLKLEGYTGLSGSKLGLTGGNIQTSGTLTLDTDGELFGTGTITGDLANNGGYVYVGIGEVTGILNLTGGYTQTASGTLVVDLRGTTAGTNYDQFAVVGTASINGVLNVTILPGYTPALGHTLNVLTSSGLTGTFSAVVGEGAFATNYTTNNAQLVRNGLTYTWDAGGGGDTSWLNPLNWSPDGLPGASDAAMLNSNATITLDTTDVTVGDFIQNNGTLTGSKTLNIIGSFSWNGGTQTGTGMTHPVAESSTVLGGEAKTLDTRTLFVQGSGSSNNGFALTLNNGAKLQAGGLYEVLLATPFQSGGNGGVIEVRPEGTLRKSGAASMTLPVGLTFTENGLLEVLGGTFSVLSGGSATDAIFRVTPGNTLNFNSSSGFSLFNNVLFEGGGTVALIGGSLSNGSTTVLNVAANTTFAISGGTFVANTTTIVNNGPLQWSGGSLTGFGTWGVNGPFDISGNAVKTLSQLILNIAPTSAGSWSGTGNLSLLQSAQINIGGTVNVLSDLDVLDGDSSGSVLNVFPTGNFNKVSAGTTDMQIATTSDGFVTSSNGGTLQFSSTFTQNSGSLSVGGGSFIAATSPLQINAGLVTGTGTFTGSLINSGGIVSPANGLNNAGILTITGDYSQGNDGELFIEAQGTTPGSGYDQLQVGGTTSLDRKLSFVTFNGYNAVAPTNFDVITSTGTISGTFPVTNLPPNGSVSYTANSVNVAFAPGDLVVDGTTGDDTLVLSVQSTVAGYTLNGGAFTPLGSVSGFIFNGGDGNDILIIDFANGNPIPATNGVNYDGQRESGGFDDKLMITGGAQGTVDYNLDNATSGSVVMSNFGTVNFTSLTPISNSGSATDVNFNLPDSTNFATIGDDGTAGNTVSRLSAATLPQLDFANPSGSLTFNSSSGDDSLTINALPDFNASLTIGSVFAPFVALTFAGAVTLATDKNLIAEVTGTIDFASANADLAASGTGAISLTTVRNIVVASGASIATVDGNLTLSANQQATATSGNFVGIDVNAAVVQATGTGIVTVQGKGGAGASGSQFGVQVRNGGTINGGATGASTVITGTGGEGSGGVNYGAVVVGAGSRITSGGGNVSVTGNAGAAGGDNRGIEVMGGGQITSGGSGTVTVTGTGGGGAGAGIFHIGVHVRESSTITSGGGDVTVTGTGGGAGTSRDNYGVLVASAGQITADSSGTVTVSGTGGSGSNGINQGVLVNGSGSRITSGSGNVSVTGVEGSGSSSVAINVVSSGAITTATNGGTATVIGNSMNFDGTAVISAQSGSSVTLRQTTNGTAINLGGADASGTLGLTDAELDQITAGTVQIGDGNSGAITVSAAITHANNLTLTTPAGITFNNAVTMAADKNLTAEVTGTINFATTSADLSATGTGAISLTTARDFNMFTTTGWSVTTADGNITLNANQQIPQTAGSFYGVQASNGLIEATGSGNIVINGQGGIFAGAVALVGIAIDPNTTVRTNTGSITMVGTGGQTLGDQNNGLQVHSGSVVESTGGGSIDLTGNGGGRTSGAGQIMQGIRVLAGGIVSTTGAGNITLTGNGGAVGAASDNYGVRIDDAGAVTSSGSGTITINATGGANAPAFRTDTLANRLGFDGTNTYTGNIVINADSMDITNAIIQTTGTVSLLQYNFLTAINLGAADSVGVLGLTDAELDQITAGILQIGDNSSGDITVSAAITRANNNAITLTATFGQNINLNASVTTAGGAFTLSNDVVLGASVSLDTTNAGAVSAGADIIVAGNINLGANTLTWNSGATDTTIATDISGTGALTKRGTGKLTLSGGSSNYSGGTTISNGTLQTIRTSSAGTGTITLGDANTGAGNVEFVLANNTVAEPVQSNPIVVSALGTGTATISDDFFSAGQLDYAGSLTLNRATTIREGTNNSTLFSGRISGNVGTLTLTGASGGTHGLFFGNASNDFAGNVVITGGANALIFGVSVAGSIPDTASVTVDGTFLLGGVNETINALNGSGVVQNGTGANTLTVGGNGGTGTFSGAISNGSGALTLIKSGAGTQTLTGANSYTGATTVSAGTLQIGNGGTTGSLSTSGTVSNNGTLTFNRSNTITQGTNFASVISGTGAVVQAGSGTLVFSGVNTYTGVTNVNAGTLIVGGSLANGPATTDVTVASGAILAGIGTIGGTVSNSGTVQPGDLGVAGELTISGNYTQTSGGILAVDLGGTIAGELYDVLSVGGTATLAGTLDIANVSGFTPANGNTFRVVQSAGNPGTFTTLTGDTAGLSQAADGTGLVLTSSALTYVWDNSAGNGDWFNALNWDLDSGVPGASDIAILNIASTINLTTGVSVGTFTQTTGTVTGVGNMTIGTSFTWSGGTQSGAATLIIGTGATATLSGSGTKTLDSRFIQNDGTLTITGSGALSLLNGPTITNNGIWDYQSDADLRQDDTTNALFKNTGGATLRKTTGAGAAATVIGLGNPNLAFENDGAIEVMAGTLTVFSSGGVWEGSPTVAISASATVGFTGGNFTWNAAPALSGGGTLDVGGAANVTLAGGTPLTVPTGFTLSKSGTGVLTGDGNMMVDGVFTFAGGTHSGTGTTTIAVGGTWNLTSNTGNMFLDGRTVNLNGTANYTGSATAFLENGTTIDNAGTFIISGDGDLGTGAGTSAFNNLTGAILRKTGGTGDTDIGSASGGTAVNFTNGGTVESQAGRLFFNDTYSQHAGEMILSGGAFATGSTLIFAGGELLGAGTITGNVNNTGATVRPGGTGAAGTLTITGAYTQGTGGMLAAELGGTGGGQFDVLSAGTGTTLDGTLNIANISGFTPANANTFRVVQSAGNPGTFAALTGDTTNISQSADATGLLLTAAVAAGDETDVSLSGGDLIVTDINGGTSNDMLTVVINGTNLRVSDPGNQLVAGLGATQVNANTVDVPLASITGNIQFNTLAGDDTLTVDFSGGNFSNQIEFIGGANTATGDKLSLTGGGTFALALFSYTNANDGFVEITGNFTIIYTGIEPISSTITAAAMELDYFPAAAGTITVSDSGVAGRTLVSSTLGAATTFVNPSGSLDISTGPGAGNHAINVQGVGSSFGADLTIEGQTGTETVNFQTNATTIGGLLTVLSENVNFNAAVTSAGLTTSATAILVSATLNHGAVNATFSSAATLTGNGAITNTGGALRLTGSGFTANFSGTIGDLELAMTDAATLALIQSLRVSDSLLIQTVGFITASSTSEAILVSGNVTSTDTTGYTNINSTITLTGTGTSSFNGPGTGLQGNLSINKTGSSGIAQFATDETFAAVGVVRGILDLSGRTITSTFIVGGGTLSGTGTINGNVNVIAGTVSPGGTGTAGTITISGDYTQGAGGTLAAELGGVSAVQYDALDIGGTAALAGILSVTNSPSFIPADGSFFTLVTASSVTGGFNTISASGYTPDQSATAFAVVAGESTVVAPKDPFTFSDQNGDIVKVTLTGKGSVNVVLQGGVSDNADIASIELIGTDLTSKLNVVITSKPQFDASFGTDIGRIFTSGALQHVGSITLGSNINLGDGVRDATPDLRVTGKMNALVLGNLSQGAYIKLGEGLPYNVPNESKTPDTYNNRPSLTVGHVLGAGVNIEVLGDGTPEGVGGGGFSKVVFKSWAFNGHLRTTQGIGSFVVKTGDFYGILEVDKFSNGEQNTASVGSMSIAQGAWGSSGSEIEGNVGSFDAAAFLAGASITAGSIGSVKTTGALAGTFILTDPDAAAVPTFTVNSDFTGRVVSAVSIKKLKIKGDFTGSLEAPSIGSITAFAFLGTAGVTDITTTAGKLGLLTSTAGIVRDYTIVSDAAFSGIKVKLGKLSSSTVGIDNVHVTATSIGAINVDLSTAKGSTGVDLTGIRNSSFTTTATGIVKGTTGSIGKVTVKLKGGTDGDGTGIINTTFDARVLAGEFGMGLLASTVNSLGNVSVNLSGFGGSSIGLDDAAFEGDVLGTTTVAVTRGKGASTARGVDGTTFTATGAIGALSFSGDVTANMVTDTEVLAGGKIAGLKVAAKTSAFGSLVDSAIAAGQSLAVSGTDKQQKAALTAASLGVVSISGSLTSSKIVAGANIGAVTVGASATDSLILAGAKLGGDFTVGDGNESYQRAAAVTSVTVGGAFTRSSIVAGIASTNATFGDADDALAAVAGILTQSSSIGALKFGAGSGTNVTGSTIPHSFAIQAAAIKSLANADSAAVKDFTTALYLDAGTAGEDATDVLVRLRA